MTQRLSASRNIVGRNRIPVNYPEEAQCSMQLECNVFMRRGIGNISFTRATPATVIDHEWSVLNVLSGEVRFQNARRVRNLVPYSQELTNVSYSRQALTAALSSETVNGIPVYTLTDNLFNVTHYIQYALAHVLGNKYMVSAIVKAGTLPYIQIAPAGGASAEYANFDLSNGTITGGNTSQATITPVSGATGYYRISLYYTSLTTASQVTWLIMIDSPTAPRVQTYIGTGKTILATAIQIEDVTRQSVLLPAEYVSTNVLSWLFHGAMVDGVKYFNTRLDGTYIEDCGYLPEGESINICTRSEDFTTTWTLNGGLSLTPNSVDSPLSTKASTITLSATSWSQFLYFPMKPTASRHGFSIRMKSNWHNFWQIATSSVNGTGYVNFDISNGATWNTSGFLIKTKALKDGFYEIKVTTSVLTVASGWFAISAISALTNGRLPNAAGTGTSGAHIIACQIEVWVPTSYIPTSGATATRNDDILTIDLANTQSTQGTWFADTTIDLPSSSISGLSITGRVFGSITTLFGVYWNMNWNISFHDGANTNNTSNSYIASWRNKVAYGFSGSTMTAGLNGTNTPGTFDGTNSFTALCIGNTTTTSRGLLGTIRNVQLWWYRLSDADIALITTL